eukprot:TRINITY_DN11785_c0_g2_i1.p1 TRINITY_DN11785_c0_g2~~TRINITY_DN11785_c0_g2_i1.p1  ORF type:complete len:1479 (-),score=258.43 TRINITY_DN11785_c0_g2_i1:130-4020(-)
MELLEPAAVISDSPLAQELLAHRPGVQLLSPKELLASAEPGQGYEDVPTTLDSVLAYMFTSGSTGRSKCVTATNRMAWAEVQWYPEVFRNLGVKIDPSTDRWRNDHEMGWWGAAYFGEIDVALAMSVCIVMMRSTDVDIAGRGVTLMGALPSQLQNLWPGAKNVPKTLRVVFSWAERCDVELGQAWKRSGVKMADLLIASEYWLTLGSCNLEVAREADGRAAHVMRPVAGARVVVLGDDGLEVQTPADGDGEVSGLLAIGGPQVSPGYAELNADGIAVIGSGELSRDTFRALGDEWLVVPKDLVRRRVDGGILSIGRAGGTVKLKGGVLVATNVAELELQQRSVAAACITDPVHVEGGSCVVLEMNWQDKWSLKECFQQASFLRMPILFMCEMPRNPSTGKVQKALVQELLEAEHVAETAAQEELSATQRAQLAWYGRISAPALLGVLLAQSPRAWLQLGRALASLGSAAPSSAAGALLRSLATLAAGAVLRGCLVAWTYGAAAHVTNLTPNGGSSLRRLVAAGIVLLTALAGGAVARGVNSSPIIAGVLVSMVIAFGMMDKVAEDKFKSDGLFEKMRNKIGRIVFALIMGVAPDLIGCADTWWFYVRGLLLIFALNRRLPPSPKPRNFALHAFQRTAAILSSALEAPAYMVSLAVVFGLTLPSLILAQFSNFAWARLQRPGQPVAQRSEKWIYSGPRQSLSSLKVDAWWDGSVSTDVNEVENEDAIMTEKIEVHAQTPAGTYAQTLARKAGVDFESMDSLKIARLSVMLKKHLKKKVDVEPIDFAELRDACTSEQNFLDLIDVRMEMLDENDASPSARGSEGQKRNGFMSWVNGKSVVHREGPTQAPWSCQVDVLMEWTGPDPMDQQCLQSALKDVMRRHPELRARPPPDDSTDALMGNGMCDFSTLAASTWCLISTVWSQHKTWEWPLSRAVRWVVSHSLWHCWPRTVILEASDEYTTHVKEVSGRSDGTASNIADEVNRVLCDNWDSFWNPQSMVNVCIINLDIESVVRQFVYCSTSHKYSDGGSIAAFVHALGESYEAQVGAQTAPLLDASHVLRLQQERLWNYLQARPCPHGSIDAYFQDINNDSFHHGRGSTVAVYFTERVCESVRTAGLRMACSEEIAWLSCMICALCRLMPDEKLIKVLMVHNGRLGEAENVIACTSQYVLLTIPCANDRTNTPLADIASRVKHAVTNGKFRRPEPCEQTHAKINIGGMIGSDGHFTQIFKTHRGKKSGESRAPHVLQIRMDNEGGIWSVKDFKLNKLWDPKTFWQATLCASQEIADGWFNDSLTIKW